MAKVLRNPALIVMRGDETKSYPLEFEIPTALAERLSAGSAGGGRRDRPT